MSKYEYAPAVAQEDGDILDKWNQLSEDRIQNFGQFATKRLAELQDEAL
jgi:hypothetical protein